MKKFQDKKKLKAIEMWMCKRLKKVSWTDIKIKIDILKQVEEKCLVTV